MRHSLTQLDMRLLGLPTVGTGDEAEAGGEVCHETTRCQLSSDHWTALSVSGQAARASHISGLEITLRVEDSRFWKAAESAAITDPLLVMVQA